MKITIELAANTAKFQSEFQRAERSMKDRMASMERAAKAAGAAMAAGLAAGATAAAAAIRGAVNRMDDISKSASRIGIGTQALSGLEFAARLSDVSLEQLSGGVLRLTKNIGEAAAGNKLYADTFRAVGIATTNADGSLRKTEDVLGDVADVFAALPDGAEKSKLAIDLFGRSGAQLIPLLNNGRDGLREMTDEARALGLVFDDEAGRQAEQFNDGLTRVSAGLQGAATQIGLNLLPKLTEMTAVLQSDGFRDGFGAIIEGAATATIKVAELVSGLGNLARFGGEELAARMGGPAMDDIPRIEDAIARQRRSVADAEIYGGDPGPAIARLAELEEMLRAAKLAAEEHAAAQLAGVDAANAQAEANTGVVQTGDALLASLRQMREEQAGAAASAKALADAERQRAAITRVAAAAQARAVTATGNLNTLLRQQAAALGGPLVQASVAYAETLEYIDQLQADMAESGPLTAQAQQALTIARENAAQAFAEAMEGAADATDLAGQALDDLMADLNRGPFDGLLADIELVKQALQDAFAGEGKYSVEELQGALTKLRIEGAMSMVSATQQVLGSIQQLSKEGSNAYKAMEVASQALNVVLAIGAVLNQGKGDPYTAFARMAAMAVAVAGLVGSIGANFGGSNGFTDTAAERQATQGRGTVLGDAEAQSRSIANATEITADATSQLVGINRGMLNALQQLQGGIASAGGMLARGAGQAGFTEIGGSFRFADNFLGGALSFAPLDPLNLLGGSSRITDQGLMIGGGGLGDVGIQAYQEQQYRRWRFGSRRTREELVPVADDFAAQFQLIVDSIADTVRRGAEALGMLPADIEAALEAFRLEEIRISLKDLSAEEQQQELLAVFSQIFDNLAGDVVPFIEQFQRVGEGLGETLVRVATGVQVTREALLRLGFALDEMDPERFAQASEALIDLVGGIDEFISGMNTFMRAFAPDSHIFAVAQDELARALEQVGLTIPPTRDAMWELMQSLDATTESGRNQIATLLRLAGVADTYYSLLEDGADDELQARIEHLEELRDAQRAYYDFAEGIAEQFAREFGSDLNTSLIQIERQYRDNIRTAGELARAAGMAGAAEQDLARIELIAARQRVEAIRLTEQSARELAGELGLTELSALEMQIADLESAAQGMQGAVGGVSDAFDAAAQRARETMDLLLGDLSPLRDREKLDLALQGLREGTVSADTVLQIGRRLFASGADYRQLFDQVMAINAARPLDTGPDVGGPVGPSISPELERLMARRDEILGQQAAQQARANALDLVEQIAELASVQAMTFEEVAASLGIDLAGLADILQVDSDTLAEMLQRQADEAAEQRDAVLGVPERFADAVAPIEEELEQLREQVAELIAVTQQVATNTARTADSSEEQTETVRQRALFVTAGQPRSNRFVGNGEIFIE